ncbi:MAG: hypothetical protein COA78_20425 [Blastopirellula sp.]|nr:MAG: hypothetical protein COA78_20425 [Blastopirellula sp.]
MKTSSAKSKGRRLQQWTRDAILGNHPSLEPDDVRSTSMGASGEDVLLSPAARKLVPFSIECKNLARMAFYQWYDQAVDNTPEGVEPMVVAKMNRRKPMVIVDAEFFFNNYRSTK